MEKYVQETIAIFLNSEWYIFTVTLTRSLLFSSSFSSSSFTSLTRFYSTLALNETNEKINYEKNSKQKSNRLEPSAVESNRFYEIKYEE